MTLLRPMWFTLTKDQMNEQVSEVMKCWLPPLDGNISSCVIHQPILQTDTTHTVVVTSPGLRQYRSY